MPGSSGHWSAVTGSRRFGVAAFSDERSCALPSETPSFLDPPWVTSMAPGEITSGCLMIERLRDCLVAHRAKRGPGSDNSGSDSFGELFRTGFAATSSPSEGSP